LKFKNKKDSYFNVLVKSLQKLDKNNYLNYVLNY